MIIFIDDERWIIDQYLENLSNIAKKNANYITRHFFFPVDALDYIKEKHNEINVIILDIGMDYGDGNILTKEPGGVQLFREIRNNPSLKKIPVIILTVFSYESIIKYIDIKNDKLSLFINRGELECEKILMEGIGNAVNNNKFN